MKKILLKISAVGASLSPALVLAQSNTIYSITNLGGLLDAVRAFINAVTPVLISVSVFMIIIGIVLYFVYVGNEDKKTEAKNFIIYGVIFLFLMISIYGLLNILKNTVQLDNSRIQTPTI